MVEQLLCYSVVLLVVVVVGGVFISTTLNYYSVWF